MRYIFSLTILMIVILISGCVSENKTTIDSPAKIPTPPDISSVTTIPQTTVVSTTLTTYKNADIVMELNKYPASGIKIDYPSDWTYSRQSTKNILFLKIGESLFYPKSYVQVYFDDLSGSGIYWYSINKWANNTIKSMTETYCLNGAGEPTRGEECSYPEKTMYHPVLISNDPFTIPGTFEARKLVFKSYDDRNYGQSIVYLMHSGQMQGYNYTVPDHPEVAVKVDGPAWDYGVGGQGYAIEFYSTTAEMNSTSSIFDHMINSLQITSN